jgi:sec-independent protein translocase protein TatC
MKEEWDKLLATYGPHLEELRSILLWTFFVFGAAFAGGFFGSGAIARELVIALTTEDVVIASSSPFQFLNLAINIGLAAGVLCAFGFLAIAAYRFLSLGLNKRERRIAKTYIASCIILFAAGSALAAGVLWYAMRALAAWNESIAIANIWDISTVLSQIIITSLLLGLIFQFPAVMVGLVHAGAMRSEHLTRGRRVIIFCAFVLVALLPPTDGLSLVLMTTPVVLLFEGAVLASRALARGLEAPLPAHQ